ncbi:hypothetical protein WS73_05915 [Burkholderia savannae]|nr:hypothetical protein WS73_05915 [Burkholderia savannae]
MVASRDEASAGATRTFQRIRPSSCASRARTRGSGRARPARSPPKYVSPARSAAVSTASRSRSNRRPRAATLGLEGVHRRLDDCLAILGGLVPGAGWPDQTPRGRAAGAGAACR